MVNYKIKWEDGQFYCLGSLRKFFRYDRKPKFKKILRDFKFTLPYKKIYE